MASKPTTLPVWATDATLASGSQSGLSTIQEPSLGYKQQGCVPGKSAPGRFMNWLFNLIYEWIIYLDDLHNSSAFLSQNYVWTASHTFNQGALIEVNAALADSAEAVYTDSAGSSSPRTRTVQIPLHGQAITGASFIELANGGLLCQTNQQTKGLNFVLPVDAVLTRVRLAASQAVSPTTALRLRCEKNVADWSTYGPASSTSVCDVSGSTATTAQLVDSGALSFSAPAGTTFHLRLTSSDNAAAGAGDSFYSVEISFTETRGTGHY